MRNLFYQAWVAVKSFGVYSFINFLGLALSLACVMTLTMYVHRERTTDTFHENAERIYVTYEQTEDDAYLSTGWSTDTPIGYESMPGVEAVTSVTVSKNSRITADERRHVDADVMLTDSAFFHIFDGFRISQGGTSADVLRNPATAVLNREFAERAFPGRNPVGERIVWSDQTFTVTGIFENPPHRVQSSIRMDVVLNTHGIRWTSWSTGTACLLLSKQVLAEELEKQIDDIYQEQRRAELPPNTLVLASDNGSMHIIPLPELYFATNLDNGELLSMSGSRDTVRMMLWVAVVIFLIGLFNYLNISSVLTRKRGRELGVKRIFGADNGTLLGQLIAEGVLVAGSAAVVGLLLVENFRPLLRDYFSIEIIHSWGFDIAAAVGFAALLTLVGAIAPYLKFRRGTSVEAMKPDAAVHGRPLMRTSLVFLQYVMTVVLIVVSVYFIRQLHTLLNADCGFDTSNVLVADSFNRDRWHSAKDDYEEQRRVADQVVACAREVLDAAPFVRSWGFCDSFHEQVTFEWLMAFRKLPDGEFHKSHLLRSDRQVQIIYGLQPVEGRLTASGEVYNDNKLVLSESAARLYGAKVGDMLEIEQAVWMRNGQVNKQYEVVGVVKDIHLGHASRVPRPLIFVSSDYSEGIFLINRPIMVRYDEGAEEQTVELLRRICDRMGVELRYTTLDAQMRSIYDRDKQITYVYTVYAIVAIFISSLGLFGLSLFDVQRRRREIAIRRVNGATERQIVNLLLRRYYVLIGVAFVVACPVAWWIVGRYTEDFAIKAPLSWWIFVLAALITLGISLATLLWQTLRAARENPADAVKKE